MTPRLSSLSPAVSSSQSHRDELQKRLSRIMSYLFKTTQNQIQIPFCWGFESNNVASSLAPAPAQNQLGNEPRTEADRVPRDRACLLPTRRLWKTTARVRCAGRRGTQPHLCLLPSRKPPPYNPARPSRGVLLCPPHSPSQEAAVPSIFLPFAQFSRLSFSSLVLIWFLNPRGSRL